MTTPEAAALRHHEPAIRQSDREEFDSIECECGDQRGAETFIDHLVRALTPLAPEVPPLSAAYVSAVGSWYCCLPPGHPGGHGNYLDPRADLTGGPACQVAFPADPAPEVPPRRDGLLDGFRAALHVHCSPLERCSLPLHFEDDAAVWFEKHVLPPRSHDALYGQTVRSFDGHASVPTPLPAETPFSVAATRTPEPPDSGCHCVRCVEARATLERAESADTTDWYDELIRVLDKAATQRGRRTAIRVLRSGSPAPEGGE